MSDSALDDLRFLEKRFRGVLELITKLEKITSLENYLTELEKLKVKLQGEVSSEEDSLDALIGSKDVVGKEIENILADAKERAAEVVADAGCVD